MRTALRSLAIVAVLAVAGCSASGTASDDSAAGSVAEAPVDGGGVAADSSTTEDLASDADRQVVVTGTVSMTVDDPLAAAQDAAMIVEAVGGHIQERVEQSAQDETSASAYLVMRIPAAAVTDALASIGELGTVEGTSLTSTEVTAQAKDLDARIHALQVSVSRLEDLLGRAGSIDDVVAAEQVLTDRQSQLESLQSQRNALAEQVDLSTIRLDLWSAGEAPSDPNPSFFGGLATGWDALVVTLTGALALIGVLIPWFVFVALVVAVVWFVRRQVLSRRPPKPPRQDAPPTWPGWSGPGPVTSLPLAPGAAPVARPAAAPTAAPVAASPAATVAGPAPQTSGTPAGAPPETQPLPPA